MQFSMVSSRVLPNPTHIMIFHVSVIHYSSFTLHVPTPFTFRIPTLTTFVISPLLFKPYISSIIRYCHSLFTLPMSLNIRYTIHFLHPLCHSPFTLHPSLCTPPTSFTIPQSRFFGGFFGQFIAGVGMADHAEAGVIPQYP
jgi:hypothetical protein